MFEMKGVSIVVALSILEQFAGDTAATTTTAPTATTTPAPVSGAMDSNIVWIIAGAVGVVLFVTANVLLALKFRGQRSKMQHMHLVTRDEMCYSTTSMGAESNAQTAEYINANGRPPSSANPVDFKRATDYSNSRTVQYVTNNHPDYVNRNYLDTSECSDGRATDYANGRSAGPIPLSVFDSTSSKRTTSSSTGLDSKPGRSAQGAAVKHWLVATILSGALLVAAALMPKRLLPEAGDTALGYCNSSLPRGKLRKKATAQQSVLSALYDTADYATTGLDSMEDAVYGDIDDIRLATLAARGEDMYGAVEETSCTAATEDDMYGNEMYESNPQASAVVADEAYGDLEAAPRPRVPTMTYPDDDTYGNETYGSDVRAAVVDDTYGDLDETGPVPDPDDTYGSVYACSPRSTSLAADDTYGNDVYGCEPISTTPLADDTYGNDVYGCEPISATPLADDTYGSVYACEPNSVPQDDTYGNDVYACEPTPTIRAGY